MTKTEKELVKKFLTQMTCNVGQHDGGLGNEDCIRDDKEEIATYNKLAEMVGLKKIA